jgi:hypothetical protein
LVTNITEKDLKVKSYLEKIIYTLNDFIFTMSKVNEKLGLPDFLYDFSANLYERLISSLKSGDYNERPIKDEDGYQIGMNYKTIIEKNDDMKYHEGFDYGHVKIYVQAKESYEYIFFGASFAMALEKVGDGRVKHSDEFVDFDNKKHNEIQIRLQFGSENYDDIELLINELEKDKNKIVSTLGHEIFHSFDALKNPDVMYNSIDTFYNEADFEIPRYLPSVNTFLHYLYLSYSFELKAHLAGLGIEMKDKDIKRENFLQFLQSDDTYKHMKDMRDLTFDKLYNNIEDDFQTRMFLTDVGINPMMALRLSPEEVREGVLTILQTGIIRGVVSGSIIPRNFVSNADLKARGKQVVNEWGKKLGKDKDYKKYFEDWIKKFNRVGDKYSRKMAKLYGHLDENTDKKLKHIKLYEEFFNNSGSSISTISENSNTINENSFFDSQTYKGKTLYRAMDSYEFEQVMNKKDIGFFFSESEEFAKSYGDYMIKAELNTDNVFNSLDPRMIHKLYEEGFTLTDDYISMDGDEERYPTYNFHDDEFSTAEAFLASEHAGSDTWEAIEHSQGVLAWIMGNYDACIIVEGGVVNYYIEEPFKYLKNIRKA